MALVVESGFTHATVHAESALDRLTAAAYAAAGIESRDVAEKVIDEVLTMARQWHDGLISIGDVRRMSTPQERFLAARFIRPHPPALRAMFNELIDTETYGPGAGYRTKHGIFTVDQIDGKLTLMDRIDGYLRIRFAIRWPWRRRPKADGITEEERQGERGEPIFARDAEERRRIAEERTVPRPESLRNRWGS